MSADLDITEGIASFVSARTDAWHHLGETLPEEFTAEQAMQYAHLGGWNARKQPLYTETGDGLSVVPGRYAVVRNNPIVPGRIDVLGDVGESYRVVQNEEHADFLNTLVDESGAIFDTAGALDGGRKVFISMRMPNHIQIGGVDRVDLYLVAINSMDGSLSFTVMATPIRIVCKNTLNLAFGNVVNIYRVRHTSGIHRLMVEAREALDMSFKYSGELEAEAERLIQTTLTQQKFEEMIQKEFGAPEGAPASTVTRTERKLDKMAELFADSYTQKNIGGTAWAGLNALTEWADHFSPARGDAPDTSRAVKAVLDPSFKNRALKLMQSVS